MNAIDTAAERLLREHAGLRQLMGVCAALDEVAPGWEYPDE